MTFMRGSYIKIHVQTLKKVKTLSMETSKPASVIPTPDHRIC